MRVLSAVEVSKVSGGITPITGGALGALSYGVTTLATGGRFSWGGLAGNIVFGAVTGGFSSIKPALSGLGSIAKNTHATAIGALAGAATNNIITGNGPGNGISTLHDSEE